jgi:hypothetical protein
MRFAVMRDAMSQLHAKPRSRENNVDERPASGDESGRAGHPDGSRTTRRAPSRLSSRLVAPRSVSRALARAVLLSGGDHIESPDQGAVMGDIIIKYAYLKQRESQSIEDEANQKIDQEDQNQEKVRDLNRVLAKLDTYIGQNQLTLDEYNALSAELHRITGKTLDDVGVDATIKKALDNADAHNTAYLTNDGPNTNDEPDKMKRQLTDVVEKNIGNIRDDLKGNESRMNLEMQMAVSDMQTAQQATSGLEKKEEDHRAALQRFIFG